MPAPVRLLTCLLPPRYFVASLQTLFLAGDVPSVLVPNGLALLAMAAVLFAALAHVTRIRLERRPLAANPVFARHSAAGHPAPTANPLSSPPRPRSPSAPL